MTRSGSIYRTFLETKQEGRRLTAALEGFFSSEEAPGHREEYGAYLRRRIRPAAWHLIREGEVEKLARLETMGWFRGEEVELFIEYAIELDAYAALMWLQRLKREKYGYRDCDLSL